MTFKDRARLRLEALEDRCVPTTTTFNGGNLLISNPNGALTLTQTAQNQFMVQTGASSGITYSNVGNISITGSNLGDSITVNLATFTYTGSLTINSGNGNDMVSLTGSGAGVAGNTTILTGLGSDTVNLNSTGGAFRFGGSVSVTATTNSTRTVNFGNSSAATTVGGSLNITGFSTVNLGVAGTSVADMVGGSLSVQDSTLSIPVTVFAADGFAFNTNVTVNTGSAADNVAFRAVTVTGTTSINLGDNDTTSGAQDFVILGQFGVAPASQVPATFNGTVTLTQGVGIGSVRIASGVVVGGDLKVNLGNGNNNFTGDSISPGFIVGGSVTINAGNGDNNIGVAAQIGGNLNITLGNSDSTGNATFVNYAPGGTLNYHGGNGPDFLGLFPVTDGQVWNVNVVFGSNDDTFDLGPSASATLTGYVDGGGSVTGNTFIQGSNWTLGPNLTITNF